MYFFLPSLLSSVRAGSYHLNISSLPPQYQNLGSAHNDHIWDNYSYLPNCLPDSIFGPLKIILHNADWVTLQKHIYDLLSSLSKAVTWLPEHISNSSADIQGHHPLPFSTPSPEFHTPWSSPCVHLRLPLWRNCLFITHHLWYPHYPQYSDWQALAHIHVYMWKWRRWSRVYAVQNVWHMNEERVISPNENKRSVVSIRRGESRSGKHSICSSVIKDIQ